MVALPVLAVRNLYNALKAAGQLSLDSVGAVARANPEVIGMTKVARAVGLFFDIAIPWGFALYDIISNDLKPGSIAFNTVIASAVAATIVALLLFAIGWLTG